MFDLKPVLQLGGGAAVVSVWPPEGGGRAAVRRGGRTSEVGGVRSTRESGRECVRSSRPHLSLQQPHLLQPHRQGAPLVQFMLTTLIDFWCGLFKGLSSVQYERLIRDRSV